jgi:hypothetical protein
MLSIPITLHLVQWVAGRIDRRASGQATAEYALVLLGAASIALLVVAWAARSGRVGDLLDAVFNTIGRKVR